MTPEPNPRRNGEDDPTLTSASDAAATMPNIGPYVIIRKIGEGGMGVVYHARQLEPIRRDVAIKLIRPGMDSRHVIARFESERQALALMDHPNIARVLDAGTTPDGLPYFVMELVFGTPITRYCDAKRLTLSERLELFVPVCRAIQHAHQKGIIHRDIKPSNVIIAEIEDRPVPKVIDFGLSKALGADLSDATMMTVPGAVVGTLRYMSPEQAEPGKLDIDTRTDVYSLGAVLYELVTGATPHDGGDASYVELLRRIRDDDPKPPSLRARRSEKSAEVAQRRRSDPSRYAALLQGELDWVVMKALDKERARRYETANALARDLERFLAGEPLEAAPPSASYRLRKLMRKHRAWIATAAAFAALLIAAAVVSSWLAIRATRAEREAIRERNTAETVSAFLQHDVLSQASAMAQAGPAARPDPDLKVRTALDRAAARIDGKFAGQPLVEASIRYTIAQAYQDLGLYPAAEPHAFRSLELRRRELGDSNSATARAYQLAGRLKWLQGKYAEAETYFAKGLEIQRRVLGEEHADTLNGIDNLASAVAYQGKWAQAEELFTRAFNAQRRVLGEESTQTLATMNNLAATYFREGKFSDAGAMHDRVLEIRRRTLGDEHPSTLVTLNNLGQVYLATGDYGRAESFLSEALKKRERVLGAEHPNTLTTVRDLGTLRFATGDYAEADRLFTRALDGRRRALGAQHPETLASVRDLARARDAERRSADADELLSKTLQTAAPPGGEPRADVANLQSALGEVRLHQRKYAEAEQVLREAVAAFQRIAPDGWARYKAEHLLGASLAGLSRFAAAEPALLSSYEGLNRLDSTVPAPDRVGAQEMVAPIVLMYKNWGKPDEAAKWEQKARR